jgi:hypothetical protein
MYIHSNIAVKRGLQLFHQKKRAKVWSFIALWIIAGCRPAAKSPAFDVLDFSYFLVKEDGFSIRFGRSDTVLLRQYESPDKKNGLEAGICYWGLASSRQRYQLDSLLQNVDMNRYSKLDSEIVDIDRFGFVLRKNAERRSLNIVAINPPKDLEALKRWMIEAKTKIKFSRIDSLLYFESSKGIIMLHRIRTKEELKRERLIP